MLHSIRYRDPVHWPDWITTLDWPTWIGAIGGVIGAAAGIAGFVIAKQALGVSRESKDEARRSADAGERSAVAAEDSARHAESVASVETARRRDELERWHQELAPPLPDQITYEYRPNQALPGHGGAWGTVSIGGNRDYVGDIVGEFDAGGQRPLGNVVLRANHPHTFFIVDIPPNVAAPHITAIQFRLSPLHNALGDAVHTWECRCAEPQREPHWEKAVQLTGSFRPAKPQVQRDDGGDIGSKGF